MKCIILTRKKIQEDSLLLHCFSEDGALLFLKIPGVLKSKKRSALFLSPATIWNFIIMGNLNTISIPKEMDLLHSPYDASPSYQELSAIQELLQLTRYIKSGIENKNLYLKLEQLIMQWNFKNSLLTESILNHFYLSFLQLAGFFHFSLVCNECNDNLDEWADYLLNMGALCPRCQKFTNTPDILKIPFQWIKDFLFDNTNSSFSNKESSIFREKILYYLKNEI